MLRICRTVLLCGSVVLLLAQQQGLQPSPADLKIHHINIAGRDLKQMRSDLSAVGIATEYGGKGANGLVEIAFATFLDGSYLELIGAQKATGASGHYWGKFIDAGAGPCVWSLFLPGVRHPKDDGRRDGDLNWEPADHENPERAGTFFPYVIEDFAFHLRKPSAPQFTGVAFVVIGVRNLDAAVDSYRKRLHYSAPQRYEDSRLQMRVALFSEMPMVLASPLNASAPLAKHIAQFDEGPYAVVLDQASHPLAGFVGESSQWFGQPIIWISGVGRDHAWIGVRGPKPNNNK